MIKKNNCTYWHGIKLAGPNVDSLDIIEQNIISVVYLIFLRRFLRRLLLTLGIKLAFLGEQHIPQSLDSQPSRSIVRSYAIILKPSIINSSSSNGRVSGRVTWKLWVRSPPGIRFNLGSPKLNFSITLYSCLSCTIFNQKWVVVTN